jgi:hypothetical protein
MVTSWLDEDKEPIAQQATCQIVEKITDSGDHVRFEPTTVIAGMTAAGAKRKAKLAMPEFRNGSRLCGNALIW